MVYNAPVLLEVGDAAHLVLGFPNGIGDGAGTPDSLTMDLALGLDE